MTRQIGLFGPDGFLPSLLKPSKVATRDAFQGVSNVYFAFRPEPPQDVEIVRIAALWDKAHGVNGRPLRHDQLHISLHAIGAYLGLPTTVIALAQHIGGAVSAAPAFDIVFDRAATFGGDRPRVLRVSEESSELQSFWRDLGIALADAGWIVKKKKFSPHMTVSYCGKRRNMLPIDPIRMRISELFLIDSHIGEGVHNILGRWPLRS